MRRFAKVAIVSIGVGLVGIQFIPIKRNLSEDNPPADFMKLYKPPVEVKNLITVSCYNCHSNNTDYPWYSYLQPVGWLLQKHIDEGKSELNFSEFDTYSNRMKRSKFRSMIGQIENDKMPLWSYTVMHRDAKLSESEKKKLVEYLEYVSQSDNR